jgi:hypothetical protein
MIKFVINVKACTSPEKYLAPGNKTVLVGVTKCTVQYTLTDMCFFSCVTS